MTWQNNYKEILDKSIEQFNISVTSLDKSRSMLEAIEERYETNMKVNQDVKTILDSIQKETDDLDKRLEQFSQMADSAKNAFPVIESNIDQLTNGFLIR